MADPEEAKTGVGPARGGDRRRTERRSSDRRRDERRNPPPWWRTPAAYVGYGVAGTILLILLVRGLSDDEPDPMAQAAAIEGTLVETAPATRLEPVSPTRDAFTLAQYERLLAEGEGAVGEVVRAELYCGSISPVTMRDTDRPSATLARLVDREGRVGGAECRWSREGRASDFLLVVPPELAEEFARAPEVELNFVRRRRIRAQVEWLGRSEAFSLRTSGVLRGIEP